MSKTIRNVPHDWTDPRDGKDWQAHRGPRHGNNRKMYAKQKWQDRKAERARIRNEDNVALVELNFTNE
jgi:hypothetical protein